MARPKRDAAFDPAIQRILDRLGVHPPSVVGLPASIHDSAFSTVDRISTDAAHYRRPPWFPRFFRQLSPKKLSRALEAHLDSLDIGYAYRLMQGGRQVAAKTAGWAQLPGVPPLIPDDGSVQWRLSTPMDISSCSKFITAVALYRLLADRSIPLATPIRDYVPAYWEPDPTLNWVTFHMLLRHESGLLRDPTKPLNSDSGPTGGIAAMRAAAKQGSVLDNQPDYKNVNYLILRVAFAILAGVPRSMDQQSVPMNIDDFWQLVSAGAYANYVNDVLFGAASIAPRNFVADVDAAKAYATPPVPPGAPTGDVSAGAGSTGWHLSIGELTRLLSEIRRGNSILSQTQLNDLLSNRYGLGVAEDTIAGTVYGKGGRTLIGMNQGMDSAIYLMPNDLELAVFVNSVPPPATPPAPWPSHIDPIVMELIRDSIVPGF